MKQHGVLWSATCQSSNSRSSKASWQEDRDVAVHQLLGLLFIQASRGRTYLYWSTTGRVSRGCSSTAVVGDVTFMPWAAKESLRRSNDTIAGALLLFWICENRGFVVQLQVQHVKSKTSMCAQGGFQGRDKKAFSGEMAVLRSRYTMEKSIKIQKHIKYVHFMRAGLRTWIYGMS